MSFFDSMCVIRRAPESANILGRCIVVGTQALVVPNLLEVNGAILQKTQLISQSDFEACRLREERGFSSVLDFAKIWIVERTKYSVWTPVQMLLVEGELSLFCRPRRDSWKEGFFRYSTILERVARRIFRKYVMLWVMVRLKCSGLVFRSIRK